MSRTVFDEAREHGLVWKYDPLTCEFIFTSLSESPISQSLKNRLKFAVAFNCPAGTTIKFIDSKRCDT